MDSLETDLSEKVEETVPLEQDNIDDVEQAQADMSEGKDSDESDEESEPPIENPSTDVRSDMQDILDGDLDFKGSFSFSKTYDSTPHPALRVDGVGIIGLPLSTSQAKEVIANSIQAPFGKGERTIVDTAVRDTWEIDASKLHFDNPTWSDFMNGVTQEVCQTLGVKFSASQLRCEPYKLLLYETGSHFLPHQDTEKFKGMFATVIVVLPSLFTGGAAHLSHGGLSKTLDCSAGSLYKTSVLSWYTDVTHEIKPITSGYRLAIAYNLIHTRVDLKPVLVDNSLVVNQLRHVLLSWIQEASPMPAKLIYLLQHKYSHASFKGSALKGADAHKAALLDAVAKPLGFHIGLANLECHISGSGDDDDGYHDRWNRTSDEDDDGGDRDVRMGEVCDRTMTITHLVDLQDGHEIRKIVPCNAIYDDDEDSEDDDDNEDEEDNEFIPRNLRKVVESGPIDKREYEGYHGNGAGSLDLYYRRSVLVIWPHRRNPDMEYGDDPLKAADFIASTKSETPTDEEISVAEFLLRGASDDRFGDKALHGLCDAACEWGDLQLWQRAVDLYGGTRGVQHMTEARILTAIEFLGFENIKPTTEKILEAETSNKSRIELLNAIAGLSEEPVDSDWISVQRLAVIKSLKVPQKGEEKLLFDLAQEIGGTVFFHESILPQIITVARSSFLVSLANHLQAEKKQSNPEDAHALTDMTTSLLSVAIAKVDFFSQGKQKTTTRNSRYHQHQAVMLPPSPKLAFAYIRNCISTENPQLIDAVIETITTLSRLSAEVILERAKCVLIPLIPLLVSLNDTETPELVSGLAKLCRKTVELYMKLIPPTLPTAQELLAMVDAIVICEGWDMIHGLLLPKFKALPANEPLCRALIQKLHTCGPQLKFPENPHTSIASITTDLVDDLVTRANCIVDRLAIISLLNLCFDTHNIPVASKLCMRVAPTTGRISSNHLSSVLMPLLPEIQAMLTRRRISPMTEPFRGLYKRTLKSFVENVMGTKPPNATGFTGIACPCNYCKQAHTFLLHLKDLRRNLVLDRIGAVNRKHVEAQLNASRASLVASWVTRGSPQGLSITKLPFDSLPQQKWQHNRQRVIAAFDAITNDDSVRKAIIGSNYPTFVSYLNGTNTPEPVAPSNLAWGTGVLEHPPDRSRLPEVGRVQGASSSKAVINAQASSSRTAVRRTRQVAQRPTKKPRYDTNVSTDIIDLCSD